MVCHALASSHTTSTQAGVNSGLLEQVCVRQLQQQRLHWNSAARTQEHLTIPIPVLLRKTRALCAPKPRVVSARDAKAKDTSIQSLSLCLSLSLAAWGLWTLERKLIAFVAGNVAFWLQQKRFRPEIPVRGLGVGIWGTEATLQWRWLLTPGRCGPPWNGAGGCGQW